MTTDQPPLDADEERKFYKRADAHIQLSNSQLREAHPTPVCNSGMFAAARFAAWATSVEFQSSAEMAAVTDERIEQLTQAFRDMLRSNMADYTDNLDRYRNAKSPNE